MIAAVLRGLRNAVLFAGTLGAGCAAIGFALPLPEVPQVKEKLEWFRAHRDDFTVLFLGTSRVRRHIIPSLFDRLAAERGVAMRSFNLGVDSLDAPEDGYVLDEALRAAPPHLRYVFVELSTFRVNFLGQGADTIRAAYWHDWERTCAVWQQLVEKDWREIKPLKKRKQARWSTWLAEVSEWTGLAAAHGRLFLQRTTNLGRGAALLATLSGQNVPGDPLARLGPARDGFIPSDIVLSGTPLAEFQQQVATLRATPSRQRPLDRVPQQTLDEMLAKIRAHGAEPILFIPPLSVGYIFRPRESDVPLFNFCDPQQWPELFAPQYRADVGHLNTAGAEIFTRALAARFFAVAKLPAEQR
jgi:hypothetical protein